MTQTAGLPVCDHRVSAENVEFNCCSIPRSVFVTVEMCLNV